MLERLKKRAYILGQAVSVSGDGILSIDGIATYCTDVQCGCINVQDHVSDNSDG